MAQVGMHIPLSGLQAGTPSAAQFRSPTLSPRGNLRGDTTPPPVGSSPRVMGPSRLSQRQAYPSYDPIHIGSVPGSKTPSYVGPPPSRTSNQMHEPSVLSPRMMAPSQVQNQQGGMHSYQPTPTNSYQPAATNSNRQAHSSRFSAPGPGAAASPTSDEVLVFTPSYTPRTARTPPPSSGGPRRTSGGSQYTLQPLQQRQFGTNVSPREGKRDVKLSIGGEQATTPLRDRRDKENAENKENAANVRNSIVTEFVDMPSKIRDEHAEPAAKVAEKSARRSQNQQAPEYVSQLREAKALHERLRLDLEEQRRQAKEKEGLQQQLESKLQQQEVTRMQLERANQQLQEENRMHLEAREEERKKLMERNTTLETQNGDLLQRLRCFEHHQENVERSHTLAEQEKQAEVRLKEHRLQEMQAMIIDKDSRIEELESRLQETSSRQVDKDSRIEELECRLQETSGRHVDKDSQVEDLQRQLQEASDSQKDKDMTCHALQQSLEEMQHILHEMQRSLKAKEHRIREMESLAHDKEQSVQQLKHDYEQRENALHAQLQEMQAQLPALTERQSAKQRDEKEFRALRQRISDQKTAMENLEGQLRRFSSAVSIVSPGEFSRMAKSSEAMSGISMEHIKLTHRNSELETEAAIIRKEIALLRRRLPVSVCDEVTREANESTKGSASPDGDTSTLATSCSEQPEPMP